PDDEREPPPAVVTRLLRRHREPDPLDELSEREGEVLGLVAEGCSNAAIAKRLFVTERTVEWHVKHIFRKLQIDESLRPTGASSLCWRSCGPLRRTGYAGQICRRVAKSRSPPVFLPPIADIAPC